MAFEPEEPGGGGGGTGGPDYYHRVSSATATCSSDNTGRINVGGVSAFNGAIVSLILRDSANAIVDTHVFPADQINGTGSFINLKNGDYKLYSFDQASSGKVWDLKVECFHIPVNTGFKGWKELEQYDTTTGVATGQTKLNIPADPDYIAPVSAPEMCPIGE